MSRSITFQVSGKQYSLNFEDVLASVRRAFEAGLPPEATESVQWMVEVDGSHVGVKWVFSHVTGIPRGDFRTHYALDVLGRRLGLKVLKNGTAEAGFQLALVRSTSIDDPDRRVELLGRQVDEIRAFLDGLTEQLPSDERLCDWVQFCYQFELFAEGRDLYLLLSPDGLNPWLLDRTRKLARICSLKAAGNG